MEIISDKSLTIFQVGRLSLLPGIPNLLAQTDLNLFLDKKQNQKSKNYVRKKLGTWPLGQVDFNHGANQRIGFLGMFQCLSSMRRTSPQTLLFRVFL